MPMRGELRPDAARPYRDRVTAAAPDGWWRLGAVISNPDLQAAFLFCVIGFLATVNAVLYFPDFGEMVAQLAVFP